MHHGRTVLGLLLCLMASRVVAADAPVAAKDAASRFTLPEGFQATLFAGEPDIVQPIAFTFDDRGRLWVVENHSYPGWKHERKDRVLIFEDRDGDGKFDQRKLFLENGSNLSGIEWGFGGVWLCSTPNTVFVPDANGDDMPDGPEVVKLDGWDIKAQHNVTSSLAWGPDGWLYGCNGILSNSRVGPPGTPDAERTAMNCGVWRLHPTRGVFEVVAHGTTNPWGLDFDQYGQTFITNCVIQHLWHAVPGARFQRMFGQDFNPRSYGLMASCADHIHWAGGPWQEARGGERHDSHGGGHAHVGAMIYLGDNWPASYRNHLFTCNIHGNRVNQDVFERHDSGYVAHHGEDFLHAGDPWFRGMMVKYGPDGGVYVSDWTDTGECHNYEVVDRTNGRIFKVTYGAPKPWNKDLAKLSEPELIELSQTGNEWEGRHARRILAERRSTDQLAERTKPLANRQKPTALDQLHGLWTLNAMGAANGSWRLEALRSPHDVVRGWGVRLAVEDRKASPLILAELAKLAKSDPSSWVHLALASGLQRLPPADRWEIAQGLVAQADDAGDYNLSLMIWYGIEPLVGADPERAVELARTARIPLITQYIVRAISEPADPAGLAQLVKLLSDKDESRRLPALIGALEALGGRRRVIMPQGWAELYPRLASSNDAGVGESATLLALVFGDPQAVAALRQTGEDTKADPLARQKAIAALSQAKVAELTPYLHNLLGDPAVRVAALRGLAAADDAATPPVVLKHYGEFDLPARQEALGALAARRNYAAALLDAVDQGLIPRNDLSAVHVQQLQGLSDATINERLAKMWGTVKHSSAERGALIAEYRKRLTPETLAQANRSQGRAIFSKACASCHKLFDAGGSIGPELTGSQRANLDYVLSNVLDPSANVGRDYKMSLIQTADGRVLAGIIKREDDQSLTVQTATEQVVLPKEEIESRQATANSMMPEGLLLTLSPEDVRDLVGYLASPSQSPLPAQ